MATDDDRRAGPGPGPDEPPTGPLTEALASAIADFGNNAALARESGVAQSILYEFTRDRRGMRLAHIEKIAPFVGLRLIEAAGASVSRPGGVPDARTWAEILLAAIARYVSLESLNALGRESGVHANIIGSFLHGRTRDPYRETIDGLMGPLGLVVVRQAVARRPRRPSLAPAGPNPLEPFFERLRQAVRDSDKSPYRLGRETGIQATSIYRLLKAEEGLSVGASIKLARHLGLEPDVAKIMLARPDAPPPSPARPCPVELRGEGLPIRVYDEEVPPLTGIAYDLVAFAVERHREGSVCLARELAGRTTTTSDRPIRLLMNKLKESDFGPLARVIRWDGEKGGTLGIIDPGPL